MTDYEYISSTPLCRLLEEHPLAESYLENLRLRGLPQELPLLAGLMLTEPAALKEFELTAVQVTDELAAWLRVMEQSSASAEVQSVTILGGRNKAGDPENIELTVQVGEVISIVGPTGAGKSRLLEDIECLADGDTPTGRHILINGEAPERFSQAAEGRLVAELSQNMNYVMDLSVREFLRMHARSRRTAGEEAVMARTYRCANELAGEPFDWETKVTQLSGGQSRALMIADAACISDSPIVLVDEIENAGIDRKKAVELLARRSKIVLISTHDPLLALEADRRLVIKNGGIAAVLERTLEEERCLRELSRMDEQMQAVRARLRAGERIAAEEEK